MAGSSGRGLGTVLMILTGGPDAAGAGAAGFACGCVAFFGTGSAGPSTLPDQELVSATAIDAPSSAVVISMAIGVSMGLARTDLSSAGRHGRADRRGDRGDEVTRCRRRGSGAQPDTHEIGARAGQGIGFLWCLDVEGDARRLEDLGPPGDQLVAPQARLVAVLEVGRCAESDVVGSRLRQRHGVVTGDAGVDPDNAAPAQDAPGLLVGGGRISRCAEMHAVSAQ